MLDGPLACPYCLNAVEKPEIRSPRKAASHSFRYIGRIAAIALCVVGTLAAAYALVPQAIQHWDDIRRFSCPNGRSRRTFSPPKRNHQPLKPRGRSSHRKRSPIPASLRSRIYRLGRHNCSRSTPKLRQRRRRKAQSRPIRRQKPAISRLKCRRGGQITAVCAEAHRQIGPARSAAPTPKTVAK